MVVLSMSKQEFSRLDVLLRVQSGRLRIVDTCVLIGLQRRQIFRLLQNLRQGGATSLLSKRRGKPSNHRLPAEVRILALSIVRERYSDFGPTFAAEKLAELQGCSVSRETLRGWMIANGLWIDRRHRLADSKMTTADAHAATQQQIAALPENVRPGTTGESFGIPGSVSGQSNMEGGTARCAARCHQSGRPQRHRQGLGAIGRNRCEQ